MAEHKDLQREVLEYQLKAEKSGVKLHLAPENIIDAEHLDCFWYGGQIGSFEYKGYTVSIEVHGDVSATLLDGAHKEELLYYKNRNNSGAYQNEDVKALIKDDETLHKLIDDGRLVFSNNNWVEYLVFDPDGRDLNDFAWDNVLDNNVLDAFNDPDWVKSVIDEIIEKEANMDLQKSVSLVQKYEFVDELLEVIYDYSERLDLGYPEVEALRQRPDLIEKICEAVQEYLSDEEISYDAADFSKYGLNNVGEEILNISDKIISDYKALNGLYVRQSLDDVINSCEEVSKNGNKEISSKQNIINER